MSDQWPFEMWPISHICMKCDVDHDFLGQFGCGQILEARELDSSCCPTRFQANSRNRPFGYDFARSSGSGRGRAQHLDASRQRLIELDEARERAVNPAGLIALRLG